jgi:hypothetical protein
MSIQLKYVMPLMVHYSERKLALICHITDIHASDGYGQYGHMLKYLIASGWLYRKAATPVL